ncbi:MAG: rhomboid family intramembrane serine protease [Chloroflexi bacterium]|nr:rhomboid family intramembrane serine protease [Chloroflexota bacterium]
MELISGIPNRFLIIGGLLLLIWGLRLVDGLAMGNRLNGRFAIQPRTSFRLAPFIVAPFLHKDFRHLISNTIPLAVLAYLVMLPNATAFWIVTPIVMLASGLGIWLFGKAGTGHVGASSLILGYFGYVLARGILLADFVSILIAVGVLVLGVLFYGAFGMIKQIVPGKQGISTTGHLFGFLGGVLAAWLVSLLVS